MDYPEYCGDCGYRVNNNQCYNSRYLTQMVDSNGKLFDSYDDKYETYSCNEVLKARYSCLNWESKQSLELRKALDEAKNLKYIEDKKKAEERIKEEKLRNSLKRRLKGKVDNNKIKKLTKKELLAEIKKIRDIEDKAKIKKMKEELKTYK